MIRRRLKGKDGAQSLDLMVIVHPKELDKAAVRSLLADAIATPSVKPASPGDAKARDQLAASLEAARERHPDDLSISVAEALLALTSSDAKRIASALDRLDVLTEKSPLEPLTDGVKANARQRVEAARQIPLWLVARACFKQRDSANLKQIAAKLAARAQEAAGRPSENQILMAMLREQGELALERGDRSAAEAAWGRMLTLVVEPPERKTRKAAPKPNPTASPKPPAPAPAPAPPARGTSMGAGRTSSRRSAVVLPGAGADGYCSTAGSHHHHRRAGEQGRGSQSHAGEQGRSSVAPGPGVSFQTVREKRQGGRGPAIERADLDPGTVRAGDADRAVGRRARPAGA